MVDTSLKVHNGVRPDRSMKAERLTVQELMRRVLTRVPIGYDIHEIHKFKTEQSRRVVEETIVKNFMLDRHTNVHTMYEFVFQEAFLYYNLPVLYEPFSLFVNGKSKRRGKVPSYLPDFVMPFHYVNGMNVVVEPHSSRLITEDYLKLLENVKDTYKLHTILATTPDFEANGNIDMVRRYVSEIWIVRDYLVRGGMDELKRKMHRLIEKSEKRYDRPLNSIMEFLRKTMEA